MMKRRAGARRSGSVPPPCPGGGTSSVVEAYTGRPRSLERLQLIRLKAAFSFFGIPPPRLYGWYKLQTLSSA